jgi:hypothetical protein
MDPREILEACKKASKGPWSKVMRKGDRLYVGSEEKPIAEICTLYVGEAEANLQFIALARTALPELAQRLIEIEEKLHKLIAEEAEHQEKVCIAECSNRKHGYCYDMQRCEKLEAENAKLREALKTIAEIETKTEHKAYGTVISTPTLESIKRYASEALTVAGYGGE